MTWANLDKNYICDDCLKKTKPIRIVKGIIIITTLIILFSLLVKWACTLPY